MSMSSPTILACAIAGSVVMVGTASSFYWRADQAARKQSVRLERIADQARTLTELNARLPAWALRSESADGLTKRVGVAMGAAGLPTSALSSLSAEQGTGESNGNGPVRVERRRATLVLVGITLPQLGSFLQTWRSREPDWTVTQIDANPEKAPGDRAQASPGGDLPLRTVLVLESLRVPKSAAPAANWMNMGGVR